MRKIFSSKIFIWIVTGIIVLAVGYGIFLTGSPTTQRALQSDKVRVAYLQQISFAIDEYWARNQKLPETLEDLLDSRYYFVESIADPVTKEPYVYEVGERMEYRLCAIFDVDWRENRTSVRSPLKVWEHGVGENCFDLEIQPRLSPQVDGYPRLKEPAIF